MNLSEILIKTQQIILCNRIMLAESDEQKECYGAEDKSELKELFNFPELTSGFKINLNSAWIKFIKEHTNEEKDQPFKSTIYPEPFDFLTDTAKFVRELKVSNSYNTIDANANKAFSPTQMLNFCGSAAKLLPLILALKAFSDYTKDSLDNDQPKDFAKMYDEFRNQEKKIYEEVIPILETAASFVEENDKIDSKKFSQWFFLNSGITRQHQTTTANANENSTYRNDVK